MHVITTVGPDRTGPERVPATDVADARLAGVGLDDRGIELEIVALDLEDAVVVLQVMPQACGGEAMSDPDTFRLGADIADDEDLRDSQGRQVDDAYVQQAVSEALTRVRGRGRPSLSESGESPLLRVRISRDLDQAVRRAAENAGASRSEWVRKVLDEATGRAG